MYFWLSIYEIYYYLIKIEIKAVKHSVYIVTDLVISAFSQIVLLLLR